MSDIAEVKEALEWCVVHRSRSVDDFTPGACVLTFHPLFDPDEDGSCRIVTKWLIDPDAARRWVRAVSEGERVWVCLRESRIDPQQICRDDGCGWNLLTPSSNSEEGR